MKSLLIPYDRMRQMALSVLKNKISELGAYSCRKVIPAVEAAEACHDRMLYDLAAHEQKYEAARSLRRELAAIGELESLLVAYRTAAQRELDTLEAIPDIFSCFPDIPAV